MALETKEIVITSAHVGEVDTFTRIGLRDVDPLSLANQEYSIMTADGKSYRRMQE